MASVIATYPQFEKDIRTFVEHWNAEPRLTDEMLAAVKVKPDDLERSTRRGMQIIHFYIKLRAVERELAAMTKRAEELERSLRNIPVTTESGWQCPKCGRCWNPGKIQCDCSSERSLAQRLRGASND